MPLFQSKKRAPGLICGLVFILREILGQAWCVLHYRFKSNSLNTCRLSARFVKIVTFIALMMGQSAQAQSRFFNFDLVLYPYAMKWACGGQMDQDHEAFTALARYWRQDSGAKQTLNFLDEVEQLKKDGGLSLESVLKVTAIETRDRKDICEKALVLPNLSFDPEKGSEDMLFLNPEGGLTAWENSMAALFEILQSISLQRQPKERVE